jgi:HD-GYP domain-containing protein (c-di-GMP phosphodiesterase class II)
MASGINVNDGPESWPATLETAMLVVALLGERDIRLKAHCERVANRAANFAEAFGFFDEEGLQFLYLAGLLHDTGYIAAAEGLFSKPEPLSEEDRLTIKRHPVTGVTLLSNYRGFEAILPMVRHHHEAFDGSGWPDGKRGEDIPPGARILHVIDYYDRLTAGRRDNQGLTMDQALADIQEKSGGAFDPALIPKFVEFVQSTAGAAAADFILKNQTAFIKQAFAAILQKFSSGKLVPPAMPQIVFELRNIIKRPESSVKDLTEVIERDPVISLRLISVAKSPVYKGHGDVKSVQAAIPRLGFKETLGVVVAIANKSLYEVKVPQFRVLLDKLWVHSLVSAYASKLMAQSLSLSDPENLFLMGLTHDVGKVVLLRAFAEIPQEEKLKSEAILPAIQEAHQSVGNMLLKRWGFGEDFTRVVALHEGANFSEQTNKEILIVHLANLLTRKMGFSFFEWDGRDPAELPSAQLLGLSSEAIQRVEDKVKDIVKDVAHLF